MVTRLVSGPRSWSLVRDEEGHRDYTAVFEVRCAVTDGPANAIRTPGLPLPGSLWQISGDSDLWAWCRLNTRVTPHVKNQPNTGFDLEYLFSTKPLKRCKDQQIDDPLLTPPKVSGSFIKYNEETQFDRFGNPILTSSFEPITGPGVEFDSPRAQVKIEQNVATGDQAYVLPSMIYNKVNDDFLWGLPPRTIKLSAASWQKQYYGFCYSYYTRMLEFDIRFDGYDRNLRDLGTMALSGHWDKKQGLWVLDNIGGKPPDPTNPTHFIRYLDPNGNHTKVLLDGAGRPFNVQLNDSVDGCIWCSKGQLVAKDASTGRSPKYWKLKGLNGQPVFLVYDTGCRWVGYEGTGTGIQWTLEAHTDPTNPNDDTLVYWKLSSSATTNFYWWEVLHSKWRCLGPNTVILNDPGGTYTPSTGGLIPLPRKITLTAGSQPGVIHVEKYDEADFLQLGIPLIL